MKKKTALNRWNVRKPLSKASCKQQSWKKFPQRDFFNWKQFQVLCKNVHLSSLAEDVAYNRRESQISGLAKMKILQIPVVFRSNSALFKDLLNRWFCRIFKKISSRVPTFGYFLQWQGFIENSTPRMINFTLQVWK